MAHFLERSAEVSKKIEVDPQASSQSGLLAQRAVIHKFLQCEGFILNPVTDNVWVSPSAHLSFIGYRGDARDLPDREIQLEGTLTLVATIGFPIL